ncbi:hypothetical protein CPB86DRAFT_808452 [Serendipita vermifera]|nr:hypothetical protein CPB86DRAFT_808452 [Serendipita vermifera]
MSTTLRLPKDLSQSSSSRKSSQPIISSYTRLSISLLTLCLTLGTAYSVYASTYLDTSDPLLAYLPHPAHEHSYFARKSNIFNQMFVKKAWGWTSAAFWLVFLTSSPDRRSMASATGAGRVWKWAIATLVWMGFTSWFFGPALLERLMAYSGGECVVAIPAPVGSSLAGSAPTLVNVPLEYCHMKTTVTTDTHPHLFTSFLVPPPVDFRGRPRLYRGHDVSGHIFLLTLCILFLTDQLSSALLPKPRYISQLHAVAINSSLGLLAIWWWMAIMTAVYFHTPQEKLSGFLIGVLGYLVTLIPVPMKTPPKVGVPIPEDKLRPDAMHID